ncbi:MAG: 3-methyl-2-oxobutanoate hydroxymethyltransferase [Phycisphaerae bacterium]|nr:3-methyl-2-oxobutanoate hydroxymethyltransferase [Phycisphaerae bacterium]
MSTGYDTAAREADHRSQGDAPGTARKPITLRAIAEMARKGERFACLTAYDFTTARWLERAGVHLLLAGDSAANVVLGFDDTIHMPLDFAVTITAAVKRGAARTVVMADMPFMSFHASDEDAVRNAGRFMTEGLADIVKFEVDRSHAPTIERVTRSGIPVCAHIGTRPQMAAMTSGPRASGRSAESALELIEAARAMEGAGASMLLIEAVPAEVAQAVVESVGVPVIGIGAGPACHGQILVVNDLLGLTDSPPRFAAPVASLGAAIQEAGRAWVRNVAASDIGGSGYSMPELELKRLREAGIGSNPESPRRSGETQPTGTPNS